MDVRTANASLLTCAFAQGLKAQVFERLCLNASRHKTSKPGLICQKAGGTGNWRKIQLITRANGVADGCSSRGHDTNRLDPLSLREKPYIYRPSLIASMPLLRRFEI
jgi:hypothetical protein